MARPRTLTRPFDPIVVETLVAGQPLRGHPAPADIWEAVRILARRNYSDGQIGAAVGRTRRQVARIREAQQIPAPCRRTGGLRPVEGVPCLPRGAN